MKDSKGQYPPQTGIYSVKVKNGADWALHDTARLQISVGQPYHEGEKLGATIDWAKNRFDRVIVCVNDTLQRHNYLYKENINEAEAYGISENSGREWIERNMPILRRLPDFEIHRWDRWIKDPGFASEHDYIRALYAKNESVQELVEQDVMTFWNRHQEKDGPVVPYDLTRFKPASVNYLLEEIAAFFVMFKKDNAVDVYPGSTLLPCVLANKSFARIDFRRNQKTDSERL